MILRSAAALVAALLCFSAALALIVSVGIPERATYTGMIDSTGAFAPEIGAFAPDIEFHLLNGERFRVSSLRGTTVVLNFWATWCLPCEAELPELERLDNMYSPGELRLIAINTGETPATIQPWIARLQLAVDIALDPDLSIMTLYQVRGQPQTFVIDRTGIVRNIFFGAVNFSTLDAAVRPYVFADGSS